MRRITRLRCEEGKLLCHVMLGLMLAGMSGCAWFPSQRILYDQADARVGIEADPTVLRGETEVLNAHPTDLTPAQVQSLLSVVQVSGWSGTLVGILAPPTPIPLLTREELQKYSEPLAWALRSAGPTERVFFSFPKPGGGYSEDRTAGALLVRGRYLHVIVTDHSSILRADTGGGELKDIRDTKGMKLWIAKPAQPATVPDADEPKWAPFEITHISLNYAQTLALRTGPPSREGHPDGKTPSPAAAKPDVQDQVRELTDSNRQLRERLDDQSKKTKELSDEMDRLRQELEQTRPAKSSPRKTPP